jgi:hypothetical protein
MAGLRDQYEHFYLQDEDAQRAAMTTGIVTPDTNVLLDLYRFQAGARDKLFGALETLGDRLWIPYQVGQEFHSRRLDVIKDQEQYFDTTQRDVKALINGLRDKVKMFPTRIGLGEDRVREIQDSIGSLSSALAGEIAKAKGANAVRLKDRDSDKVLARLESLLDNRVGGPMAPAEIAESRREALMRVDMKIPPGFEDASKADPTGDYLVFSQLMTKAMDHKRPVVLITDDEKPDWYRRQQGVPFGARAELREEMMAVAGVPLLIITTETFLRYARKYLGFDVNDETIAQARELPSITEVDRRSEITRLALLARYASKPLAVADWALLSNYVEDAIESGESEREIAVGLRSLVEHFVRDNESSGEQGPSEE